MIIAAIYFCLCWPLSVISARLDRAVDATHGGGRNPEMELQRLSAELH